MPDIQKVNISDENAFCDKCGTNILDISNFRYAGKTFIGPTYSEELCECRKCGGQFLIRYDFFDKDGHIRAETFSGDWNNAEYNWFDKLSTEQKAVIGDHLRRCPACQDLLDEETLNDAWFANFIHEKKKFEQKPSSGV